MMNNMQQLNQPWSKEEVDFIMADMLWKAQDFELRLKSPFPMPYLFPIETDIPTKPEIQHKTDPNP